jgi:acyl carrier protein/short-subunit dehydrogenase
VGVDRASAAVVAERLAGTGADARAYAGLAELGAAIDDGRPAPENVLVLPWGSPVTDPAAAARSAVAEALALVQAWVADARFAGSRMVLVTEAAVATGPGEDIGDLGTAAARGLIRSAQAEHPGRLVQVDIDSPDGIAAIPGAVATGEPEVAVRGTTAYVRRLTAVEAAVPPVATAGPAGPALITGGTGALGALVARHLAGRHGVRRVLLTSLSGPAAAHAPELVAALAGLGADVRLTACDTADRDAIAALFAAESAPAIVVHAAGVLDDGVITSLTPSRVDGVLRPKADAAWHLHELTAGLDLAAFVLFSSAAATFGSPGQGNYAAGNAFLDALAHHRRARGLPATSVAWGRWREVGGMAARLDADGQSRLARAGDSGLSARDGLALLDAALSRDEALLVPAWLNLAAIGAADEVPALLRGLVRERKPSAADPIQDSGAPALRERLASRSPAERERAIVEVVRRDVAAVLGYDAPEAIDPGHAFRELGFDSLLAVELRTRLSASTGLRLPATVIFNYPNPVALARHLVEQVFSDEQGFASARRELDRLERTLAALTPGGGELGDVASRLEAIARKLREVPSRDEPDADLDLDAVTTDDEMFALIDRELEIPDFD